jgi:hypothetical protein
MIIVHQPKELSEMKKDKSMKEMGKKCMAAMEVKARPDGPSPMQITKTDRLSKGVYKGTK